MRRLRWLNHDYQKRSHLLTYLMVDERLDKLNSDPRFGKPSSQCAQKIDQFLLFLRVQFIKLFDDLVGLAAGAFVPANGLDQVGRASIMQEENALSHAPEGSCTKLVRTRAALGDAVLESTAHVVDEEVRKQIHGLI